MLTRLFLVIDISEVNMRTYSVIFIYSIYLMSCNLTSQPGSPNSNKSPIPSVAQKQFESHSAKGIFSFLTQNTFVPTSATLHSHVNHFNTVLGELCTSQFNDQQAIKQAFLNIVASFNELSGAPIGPLTENNDQLRDEITSYPYFNACAVDRHVAGWANNNPPKRILYNQKGLMALDYLIFNPSMETKCPNQNHPDLQHWSTLSFEQKRLYRCTWAKEISKDLSVQTSKLNQRWSNYETEFLSKFNNRPDREVFNLLVASLFRIEFLKDVKIGNAFGIYKECKDDIHRCPEYIEFPHSDITFEAIESNLKAFSLLFFGSNSPLEIKSGFAVTLNKQGLNSLVKRTQDSLSNAQLTLSNLKANGSFNQIRQNLITNNDRCENFDPYKFDSVCSLFHWITDLAKITKQDLLLALSLSAPVQHQGDND